MLVVDGVYSEHEDGAVDEVECILKNGEVVRRRSCKIIWN